MSGLSTGHTCTQVNSGADNIIWIEDPFDATYTGGNEISFGINGFTNADVSGSAGTFILQTAVNDGTGDYLVDEYESATDVVMLTG